MSARFRTSARAILAMGAFGLYGTACAPSTGSDGNDDAGIPQDVARSSDAGAPCIAMLATSQTGSSSTCEGGSVHAWPIGLAPTDCHGWRSIDTSGDLHDNSANQIQCNTDGSVSFVQFANSLDCTEIVGPGVPKTFRVGDCEQDIPPTLHTTGVNTSCCTNPTSADCVTGVPSARNGQATIYLNGVVCTE